MPKQAGAHQGAGLPHQEPGRNVQHERLNPWSRYWATGAAHACRGAGRDELGGAFASFWKTVVGRLGAGHRVLDVGAGNGAVSRLLVNSCFDGSGGECHLVDAARISPGWIGDGGRKGVLVRVHSTIPAEQLPFANASFSVVVAQFALEYCDLPAVLREIARCTRPEGRLVAVLHHRQSCILQVAEEELGHIRWLLAAEGLLQATAALLPDMALAGEPDGPERLRQDPAAEGRRDQYNALQELLAQRAAAASAPDVLEETASGSAAILRSVADGRAAEAAQALEAQRRALEDAALRLEQLLSCALDLKDIKALRRDLQLLGYGGVTAGELRQNQQLLGFTLEARRSIPA